MTKELTTVSELSQEKIDFITYDMHLYLTTQDGEADYVNVHDLVEEYIGETFHQGDQAEIGLLTEDYTPTDAEIDFLRNAYVKRYGEINIK